jgi:hypothetical protein
MTSDEIKAKRKEQYREYYATILKAKRQEARCKRDVIPRNPLRASKKKIKTADGRLTRCSDGILKPQYTPREYTLDVSWEPCILKHPPGWDVERHFCEWSRDKFEVTTSQRGI